MGLVLAWLAPPPLARGVVGPELARLSPESGTSLSVPGCLLDGAQLLASAVCEDTDDPPTATGTAASFAQAPSETSGIRECASAPPRAERRLARAHQATGPPSLGAG
jgi:hypothetical protein